MLDPLNLLPIESYVFSFNLKSHYCWFKMQQSLSARKLCTTHAAASLRHPSKTTVLMEVGGGGEWGLWGEGWLVWGPNGCFFTLLRRGQSHLLKRLQVHFAIQHNRALFQRSTPINIRACEVSALLLLLFSFFCFLGFCPVFFLSCFGFDPRSSVILPCFLRMDCLCQSRRTKRIKSFQRAALSQNHGFWSISKLLWENDVHPRRLVHTDKRPCF